MTSLLTFLIWLVTGKVFGPQYLIWVAPPAKCRKLAGFGLLFVKKCDIMSLH
jgi:hypothetical protein